MTTGTTNKLIVSLTSKVLTQVLTDAEANIRTANLSFIMKGEALTLIDSDKLYKERGFSSFDQYTTTMFDMKRNYAYKIMRATQIYNLLKDTYKPSQLPTAETHCRPLAVLKTDEEIIKVWADVSEIGRITAKNVKDMVNLHLGKTDPTPTETPNPETVTDNGETGTDTPDDIPSDTSDAEKVRILQAKVTQLENELEKARSNAGGIKASKMGRLMIQKGFAVLSASATDDQQGELIATKKALLG